MRRTAAASLLLSIVAPAFADPIDRERLERARDAVFERREFTYGEEEGTSPLTNIFSALADAIEEHPMLFYSVMVVLVITLVILLAHIVWTIRMARNAEFEGELDLDHVHLERAKSSAFRASALRHAGAGRYEEAVRDLYLALLLELDRRGAVRFASHKALLDYRLEAAGDRPAKDALAAFGGTYLPTSFGRRPLDRAHFDELVDALDSVTGGVTGGVTGAGAST